MSNFVTLKCQILIMLQHRITTSIILSLGILLSWAQPYCDVRKFSILDGLAANTISDLKQAPDRLMWFGTWNGLSYYDGYTFTTFRDAPNSRDLLSTNRISFIRPNILCDVWVVTIDHKPYIFDTHLCEFVDIGEVIKKELGIDIRVRDVFTLKNGNTWLTSMDNRFVVRITDLPSPQSKCPKLIRQGEQGLISARVSNIETDSLDREWIFTDRNTLVYGHRFNSNVAWRQMCQSGKSVFLCSADGRLAEYDEHDRLHPIAMPVGVKTINDIKTDGDTLYLATNKGLVAYNQATRAMRTLSIQHPNQPSPEATKIYIDRHKRIWVFADGRGITLVNPTDFSTRWLMADIKDPMLRTTCTQHFIMEDDHNTVWMIPSGGTFSYYDETERKLVPYPLVSYGAGNVSHVPLIDKYAISDQCILWVTGLHELTQVNFKYHNFRYTRLPESESENRSLALDHKRRCWSGFGNGVILISDRDGRQMGFLDRNGRITSRQQPFSDKGIYDIFEDARHRLWIATNGDGLYVLEKEGKRPLHLRYDAADSHSLPSDDVRDIQTDRHGRIWVCTFGGGACYAQEGANGSIQFVSIRNGLNLPRGEAFLRTRLLTATRNGEILLGTTGGLVTFSDNIASPRRLKYFTSHHIDKDSTSMLANDVIAVSVRPDGDTYVASLGGGIERVEGKQLLRNNLKLLYQKIFDPEEGIVQAVTEDNAGNLWVVREASIDKYNPTTGLMEVFGPNDFDGNTTFTEARPLHDPETDHVTIGTSKGFITFLPRELTKTQYQPRIVFTAMQYAGENRKRPILNNTSRIEIPSDKRHVAIYFAALDYSRDYQKKYAYKIKGREDEWIVIGSRNNIDFNRIPAGTTTILLKGTNTHGVWADNEATLTLYARPTFWESIWGYLFLFMLAGGLILLGLKIYNDRQAARMEHNLGEMKSRFFNDASHRLRTPLTLIGGPVAEVLREEQLSDKGTMLLEMVVRNVQNMLALVNRMSRYDNRHFSVGEGATDPAVGEGIDDANAAEYIKEGFDLGSRPEYDSDKEVTILVVEDNSDLRTFLYSILGRDYNVIMAENGKEGLEMAIREMPDFILTDVSMPVMDGLTMVHHIKQNKDISHLPIIILSARASMKDQEQGLREGVHGYITKPFSAAYLKGRIENILAHQKMYQQKALEQILHQKTLTVTAENTTSGTKPTAGTDTPSAVSSIGDSYVETVDGDEHEREDIDPTIEQIVNFIDDHIAEQNLKIDDIAVNVGMSRSVLYSKIKTAVGMTPVDFVRHIRLLRAQKLINDTDQSLTQIAYSVGFSDPKYFSKVFKREMGVTPSEYREKKD